jgi:hypothetical protein
VGNPRSVDRITSRGREQQGDALGSEPIRQYTTGRRFPIERPSVSTEAVANTAENTPDWKAIRPIGDRREYNQGTLY